MRRWWGGIDWSSQLQDFVILDDDGAIVTHLRVQESPDGVREILAALRGLNPTSHRFSRKQVPIAIEDGGRLLAVELRRRGQPVVVIPPAVSARHRGRRGAAVSKTDRGDAALLADIIRQQPGQRRTMPETSDEAAAVAVLARAQSSAAHNVRESAVRLQSHLALYFPAALKAWAGMQQGLRRPEARAVLTLAPTPAAAAALTKRRLYDTLATAGRARLLDQEAARLREVFTDPSLRQSAATERAMGERTRVLLTLLDAACSAADGLAEMAEEQFSAHPHSGIYRSFPGVGRLGGPRLFAEIGDDPGRFATARGLRAYAGTAPITWSSGTSHVVTHRTVCNRALRVAVHQWAFVSMQHSPGCRGLYDERRERGDGYAAALRRVGGRLLTGLHHCLRTGALYDEEKMFPCRPGGRAVGNA